MDYDAYDIAEIYDRARALLPATALLWQELLADYIDPGAAPLILDLGCGTGRFSELLARRFGGQVIGIDPSERHSARIAARRSIRPFRTSRPAIPARRHPESPRRTCSLAADLVALGVALDQRPESARGERLDRQ